LLLLLVVVLGQCQAQLSPDDAMAQARDAAAAKGINPDLVQEIGAPVDGEYDKSQDEKRCSGCIGSMIELHIALKKAASKQFNLVQSSADGPSSLKEIPLLDAIATACDSAVKTYGYGKFEGVEGYFHKRQRIVRTTSEKMSNQLAQMCNRLAEDADRNSLLLDAHLQDRKSLAYKTCVELNKDDPISEFFSGPMCTETEAHSWIERLLPETHLPPAGDDDIKLELEEFTRKYATRLQNLAESGGPSATELFEKADADKNGRLSRAEIAMPRVRSLLNPKTVDKATFKGKFGSTAFKRGRSAAKVFGILDENVDGLLSIEEMRELHAHLDL